MEYRSWPRGKMKVSTIGIGASNLRTTKKNACNMIDYGIEQGVNLVDFVFTQEEQFEILCNAIQGKRDKLYLQMHFGMIFSKNGQYRRSRDMAEVDHGFRSQLKRIGTDYADIGFIHCVDEQDDFDTVFSSGGFEYALRLREQGIIRHLGFASHNVEIARQFIETGEIDLFMFSINPAYDIDPARHNPLGVEIATEHSVSFAKERERLYRECEKRGIGINVMKPLGAGQLLDARTSPFEKALTVPQCLQYALDRPAVLSCLVGAKNTAELKEALEYYSTSPTQRDYSFIADLQHKEMMGRCVYCNHCLPCPSDINIGLVGKYLDLALAGDELAKKHYHSLQKNASDCICCGACEKNCPFRVNVMERMEKSVAIFK